MPYWDFRQCRQAANAPPAHRKIFRRSFVSWRTRSKGMSVSRRVALAALGVGAVAAGAAGVGYEIATGEKPEPPPPPLVDKDGHLVWRNWSGLRYSYPTERAAPSTEDELLGLLEAAP